MYRRWLIYIYPFRTNSPTYAVDAGVEGHFLMVEIRSSPRREVFSSQKAKVFTFYDLIDQSFKGIQVQTWLP